MDRVEKPLLVGIVRGLSVWAVLAVCLECHAAVRLDSRFEGEFSAGHARAPGRAAAAIGELPGEWFDLTGKDGEGVTYSAAPGEGVAASQALRMHVPEGTGADACLATRKSAPRLGEVATVSIAFRARSAMSVRLEFCRAPGATRPYWVRTLSVGARWQTFSFAVPVTFNDPTCLLAISTRDAGDLFVDDVRVEAAPIGGWARQRIVSDGNLIRHSRFPLGATNGWRVVLLGRGESNVSVEAGTVGPSGCAPLSIQPERENVSLISPPVPYAPGEPHVLSFFVRGARPDSRCVVAALGIGKSESFSFGGNWRRVRWQLTPGFEGGATGSFSFTTHDRMWIDGVHLALGTEAGDFASDRPELHLAPRAFRGLDTVSGARLRSGRVAPFQVLAYLLGRPQPGCRLVLTEEDIFGVRQSYKSILADRLRRGVVSLDIPARTTRPLGSFRLTAEIVGPGGQATGIASEIVLHRVLEPDGLGKLRPESRFGVNVRPTPEDCRTTALLGFGWVRFPGAAGWLTRWPHVEPEQGRWQWHDDVLEGVRKYGLSVLGTLGGIPAWAAVSPAPPNGAAPADAAQWRRYVRETAGRYRTLVQAWEVQGAASSTEAGQAVEAAPGYVEMATAACEEARAVSKSVTMAAPGSSSAVWTRACAAHGLLPNIDVFSLRHTTDAVLGGSTDELSRWRTEVLDGQLTGANRLPVWCMEAGLASGGLHFMDRLSPSPPPLIPRDAADRLVRRCIVELASGTRRLFLAAPQGRGGAAEPGLLDVYGAVHPAWIAASVCARQLADKRFVKRVRATEGVPACIFSGRRESVAVLVPADDTARTVHLWAGRGADLMGNALDWPVQIGREPVYLTCDGSAALAEALVTHEDVWTADADTAAGGEGGTSGRE